MELKRIYSNHFPFKGYISLAFYPWVFIRNSLRKYYTERVDRHEVTHALQQIETLWVFFLLIYGLEYIIKLPLCRFNHNRAYLSISFEQEAYTHEAEVLYNGTRKHWVWIKYVFTVRKNPLHK